MIIDADCHISSPAFQGRAITAADLVRAMDRAGVDKAVTWLQPPYNKEIEPENQAVYEGMKAHPDRLLGFGWANPRLGKERTEATIRRCFEEYGFYGIKFNGAQDWYVIDDPEVLPFIEQAAAYGKPIAFHIGADAPENTHPYRLGRIAERFPGTPFLMVHMGGVGYPALNRAAVEVAEQHANVSLVASAVQEMAILRAIESLGAGRVCFGSDTPFRLMHVQLAMCRALLGDHPAEDRARVMGGNIARLLGIER